MIFRQKTEEEEQDELDALLAAQAKKILRDTKNARKKKQHTRRLAKHKQQEVHDYEKLIKSENIYSREMDSALEMCVDDMLREHLRQDCKDEAVNRGLSVRYGEMMYRKLSWPN